MKRLLTPRRAIRAAVLIVPVVPLLVVLVGLFTTGGDGADRLVTFQLGGGVLMKRLPAGPTGTWSGQGAWNAPAAWDAQPAWEAAPPLWTQPTGPATAWAPPAMAVPPAPGGGFPSDGAWIPAPLPIAPPDGGDPVAARAVAQPFGGGCQLGGGGGRAVAQMTATPTSGAPATPGNRPFQEAHWQGLEFIPSTPTLARQLGIPADVQGLILDDVTLPADQQGFQAGDLVTAIGQVPTPDLLGVIRAADRVRERKRVEIEIIRSGQARHLVLTALFERLGTANGETAPMIKPGSRSPHGYKGACTGCHAIGTTGQLPIDQGDLLARTAPSIRAGQSAPHRDRGACSSCHTILP